MTQGDGTGLGEGLAGGGLGEGLAGGGLSDRAGLGENLAGGGLGEGLAGGGLSDRAGLGEDLAGGGLGEGLAGGGLADRAGLGEELGGGGGLADLGSLTTEEVRPELDDLDLLGAHELVALMAADSRRATEAVAAAAPAIASAVELVYRQLRAGGRLVYVGAGTAGRLAVLDAAELGPTFSVPDDVVQALIAGGETALRHPVEGAEDDRAAGGAAVGQLELGQYDVVVGVSASGRTPYVLGALERARACGSATIGLACNRATPLAAAADLVIEVVVGGEVVAGSSRLNAGTAQKITLNTISTSVMVLLGKTYGNLMVDVRATNTKLRDRAVRIVQSVTGVSPERALGALETTGWNTKLASLVAARGVDVAAATSALDQADGRLRTALTIPGGGTSTTPAGGRSRPIAAARRLGVAAAFVDGTFVAGDVAVDDGMVMAIGLAGGGSGIAVPGFVDLQVNGYAGVDVASASVDDLESMSAALARDGVLAFQPTLISGDPEVTAAAVARVTDVARRRELSGPILGALILGAHLEGPFLSSSRAGTHPVERLRPPDLELARRLVSAGHVTMVTLAPELPGAIELTSWLTGRGIVVSLGHSAATVAQAAAAVDAGASVVTHLYNGMAPISARAPGLAGFALTDARVRVQLISDGGHVADELIRLAFMAAQGRCSLVSDSTSLSGGNERGDMLGDVPITLVHGVARRADGTIAGGASKLLEGVQHLASLSLGLPTALSAVTELPARVLGRHDIGHLRPGEAANLVVLDDNLALRQVLINGMQSDSH
jgi:N-acetylglucosamine-6-phosphate deacetylase